MKLVRAALHSTRRSSTHVATRPVSPALRPSSAPTGVSRWRRAHRAPRPMRETFSTIETWFHLVDFAWARIGLGEAGSARGQLGVEVHGRCVFSCARAFLLGRALRSKIQMHFPFIALCVERRSVCERGSHSAHARIRSRNSMLDLSRRSDVARHERCAQRRLLSFEVPHFLPPVVLCEIGTPSPLGLDACVAFQLSSPQFSAFQASMQTANFERQLLERFSEGVPLQIVFLPSQIVSPPPGTLKEIRFRI